MIYQAIWAESKDLEWVVKLRLKLDHFSGIFFFITICENEKSYFGKFFTQYFQTFVFRLFTIFRLFFFKYLEKFLFVCAYVREFMVYVGKAKIFL